MTLTTMTYAWGENDWTEVQITFHRTGPAFIITHMAETLGLPRVPDAEWEALEDAAHEHVQEIVDELWAEDCESEDLGAVVLAGIRRDITAAERRLGA